MSNKKLITKEVVSNVLKKYDEYNIIGIPQEETECPFAVIAQKAYPELANIRIGDEYIQYYNTITRRKGCQPLPVWAQKTIDKVDSMKYENITVKQFKEILSEVLGKKIV